MPRFQYVIASSPDPDQEAELYTAGARAIALFCKPVRDTIQYRREKAHSSHVIDAAAHDDPEPEFVDHETWVTNAAVEDIRPYTGLVWSIDKTKVIIPIEYGASVPMELVVAGPFSIDELKQYKAQNSSEWEDMSHE